MSDVELATTPQLIAELKKRFPNMVFIGTTADDRTNSDNLYCEINGSNLTCIGLMSVATILAKTAVVKSMKDVEE